MADSLSRSSPRDVVARFGADVPSRLQPPQASGDDGWKRPAGLIDFNNFPPEREEGQDRQLQVLHGEGNADDGHGASDSEHDVADKRRQAAKDDPNDVHRQTQSPRGRTGRVVFDVFSKRNERQVSQLEALQSKGNAHHGQTQHQATEGVLQGDQGTANKDGPENVQNQSHAQSLSTDRPKENRLVMRRIKRTRVKQTCIKRARVLPARPHGLKGDAPQGRPLFLRLTSWTLVAALLVPLLMTGCKLFGVTHPPSLPTGTDGNLYVSDVRDAPKAPVDLYFDDRGIPHIFAETEADAAYALGFSHARDRLFQIDVLRHAATGRLTEIFGASLNEVDRQLRIVSLRSQASLDAMSARDRSIVESYVIGINQGAEYAGKNAAEFLISGRTFTPFTALDVVGIQRLQAWELSHDLLGELARARILNRLPQSDPRAAALLRPVPTNGVPVLKRPDPNAATRRLPATRVPATATDATPGANETGENETGTSDAQTPPSDGEGEPATGDTLSPAAPDRAGDQTPPSAAVHQPGASTRADQTRPLDDTEAETAKVEELEAQSAKLRAPTFADRLQWFFGSANADTKAKVAQWTKAEHDPTAKFFHLFGAGAGSNAWVVSGGYTASGYPVLVTDPHLRHSAPSVLYLAHIEVKERGGGKVVGATYPGIPAVMIGHTDRLAWALTTSFADTQDLVRISADPSRPDQYIVDGKPEPFGTLTQSYVASGQTIMTETWRTTRFGPVLPGGYEHLKEPGEDYAVLWTGFDPALNRNNYSAFWDLLYAKNAPDAFAAVDQLGAPSQNALFAFEDGSIAYRLMGALPERQSGAPSDRPRNGNTATANWDGVVTAERKPSVVNPPWGTLVAANQRLTADNDPLVAFVGRAGATPYRAERIHERLDDVIALGPSSADALVDIQQDVHSIEARLLAPAFANVCPRTLEGISPFVVTDFCNALQSFDGEYLRGSSGALAFTWLLEAMQQEVLTVHLGDDVARQLAQDPATVMALAHAFLEEAAGRPSPLLDDLRTPAREGLRGFVARASRVAIYRIVDALGEDAKEWRWGRVHTLQVDGFLAEAPLVGYFFFGDATEQDGHARTIRAESGTPIQRGAVLRMVAEMESPPNARMILDLGQSGHVDADNSRDQFLDWNAGILVRVPTNQRKLQKEAGALRLVPAP